MEKLILSLVRAAFGFFFSQFFNIITYFRRARFKSVHHEIGVMSSYTGGADEPWEIELGFYLENCGSNPAKNTRIFVSEICRWCEESNCFEEIFFSFSELKRPIDVLPAGQSVRVVFSKISGSRCHLEIPFENDRDISGNEFIDADTRFYKRFRANFFVICDDRNSSFETLLEFDPGSEDHASGLLEDYDSLEFRTSILLPGNLKGFPAEMLTKAL